MKRVVPMHDDLFDFFYQALPGYEEVGNRRVLLGCWGAFQDPEVCNFQLPRHDQLGPGDVRHPGRRRRRQAGHQRPGRDQPRHPHPARQLVLRRLGRPGDVRHPGPARQSGRPPPSMEPAHHPAARRSATSTTSTAGSCRRAGTTARTTWRSTPAAARSPGCGRRRSVGLVDIGYVKATGTACRSTCPGPPSSPRSSFEWKIPQWSNTIERNRARTYFQAYAAAAALHFVEKALAEVRAGRTKTWEPFKVPDEGDRLRLHRGGARRAVAPHGHPRRQDRQLPPVPADAVERQPARHLRHARARTRTRCRARRSSRRTTSTTSRASTSCAPCAASIPACRAACTCTSARARCSRRSTRPLGAVSELSSLSDGEQRRAEHDRPRRVATGSSSCSTSCRRRRRSERAWSCVEELVARWSRAVRRRAGPDASSWPSTDDRRRQLIAGSSTTSWSPACSCCTACTRELGRAGSQRRARRGAAATCESHGGDVELLGIDERRRRARCACSGSCDGCPSSAVTLQAGGRARDPRARCPEIVRIEVERRGRPRAASGDARPRSLRATAAGRSTSAPADRERWTALPAIRSAVLQRIRRDAAAAPRAGRALRAVRRRRIADEHRHLVDIEGAAHLCAPAGRAPSCSPPTVPAGAATGRARRATPPSTDFALDAAASGTRCRSRSSVAFFFRNSALERIAAFYPEPGRRDRVAARRSTPGTRSSRPTRCWPRSSRRRGAAGPCAGATARECFIVPIDACYELVGHLRRCGAASTAAGSARGDRRVLRRAAERAADGPAPA